MARTKFTTQNIEDHVPASQIVQAENGDPDEFQQYVYKDTGKLVPTGVNVGYEKTRYGTPIFYMCADVDYAEDVFDEDVSN